MQGAVSHEANLLNDPPDYAAVARIDADRRLRLVRHLIWCSWPVFLFFSLNSFLQENFILAYVTFGFACLTTLLLLYTRYFKSPGHLMWGVRVFMLLLAILFLFYIAISKEHLGLPLWTYTFPLVVFFVMDLHEGTIWATCFWCLQVMLLYLPGLDLLNTEFTAAFKLRFVVSHLLVSVMAYFFEYGRHRTHRAMYEVQCRFKASENRTRQAFEELKVAQSQLVQSGKLASIGELAAGVAHELNQPLMVIRGYAQLINRQVKNDRLEKEELANLLETIERNTKRMIVIINHLRDFSRQSAASFQTVEVNRVIEDAFLIIGEQLRLRGIQIDKHLDPEGAFIQGDAHQLEQVCLNLLSNARDALRIPKTGYHRKDQKRCITITTRTRRDPHTVEVLFADNGCGIPTKDLDAIFDPFFTTKEVGKGTGLGLSISYGIIRKHDGQIEVKSTGPEGTIFQITLPAVNPGSSTTEEAPSNASRIA